MGAPPGTRVISSGDLSDDWASSRQRLLSPLNSFLSNVNDNLAGGLRLQQNLGCQVFTFRVQTPSPWVNLSTLTYANSWADFSAPRVGQYRVCPSGEIAFRGTIKSGVVGSTAVTLPSSAWPTQDVNVASDSNGAYGKLSVTTAGAVIPVIGSNVYFSLDTLRYEPATPLPYVPTCFPLSVKCTLPQGQALKLNLGEILDVTPSSTPLVHSAADAVWRNANGNIVIDNIPGLLPSRTYQITAIAYPK